MAHISLAEVAADGATSAGGGAAAGWAVIDIALAPSAENGWGGGSSPVRGFTSNLTNMFVAIKFVANIFAPEL
jgi:hypothetical protein